MQYADPKVMRTDVSSFMKGQTRMEEISGDWIDFFSFTCIGLIYGVAYPLLFFFFFSIPGYIGGEKTHDLTFKPFCIHEYHMIMQKKSSFAVRNRPSTLKQLIHVLFGTSSAGYES